MCIGDQIKYCGNAGVFSYLAKLLNSLVYTKQEAL